MILEDKNKIRNFFIRKRLILSKKQIEKKSNKIFYNFIKNFDNNFFLNKNIAIYIPINNEVSIEKFFNFFLKKNITILIPKIVNNLLKFSQIKEHSKLLANTRYNKILETRENNFLNPDIVFVPLVSFDKNLNRVGMGKGFYDQYISNNRKITYIGLAYNIQLYHSNIPTDIWDQKLNHIISETTII